MLTESSIRLLISLAAAAERYRTDKVKTITGTGTSSVKYEPVDYQSLFYYAAPKQKDGPKSLDEVDPEILAIYAKLGIRSRAELAALWGRAGL